MLKALNALILLALAFALSPLTMAATTSPDGGLLITRTSSETWQVRLIAGSTAKQFSGTVESSVPFSTTSSVKLETADSVSLSSPGALSAMMTVYPKGVDGVDFSVSTSAKLCLRDTGSSGVKIYVGATLADAVLAAAPVALQGADACGGTTTTPSPTTGRKYHTGHYIAMLRGNSSQKLMTESIKPGVVGIMKRYTWRSLEPTLGQYDLSEIQSDLDWAAAYGMRLVVMIEDKTFTLERPTPAYLDQYTLLNRAGGYTSVRWSPYVVTRMKALVKALGRFDSNPWFEGIATQETALGFDNALLDANGYTPEKYRDAYIDILSDATVSLPTSRVFWYMNFFPRNQKYIGSIASAVASKGVIMGGPDVMPDDDALQMHTYPFYDQFAGKMPLFGQVEPVCYAHLHKTSGYKTKYWTMAELNTYARNNLNVNYMFWVRLPTASPSDSYDWLDALPVIQNYPSLNP